MAQYKVPQDVEADDKLIGPFNFRQFVYLLIAAGLIALAVALFQIFPALAIIPVPFILFLGALALPLKKDQPMETYLAAVASFYLKPRNRTWMPGQKETIIQITAPKNVEESRTRDITGEEATHRLSFLANIVDTEGYAIKNNFSTMNQDLVVEANTTSDIFESNHFSSLENKIARDENERHQEVISEMRDAINKNASISNNTIGLEHQTPSVNIDEKPNFASSVVVNPGEEEITEEKKINETLDTPVVPEVVESKEVEKKPNVPEEEKKMAVKPSMLELANNDDYSIETIAKEANRIKDREEGEVFISLH